MHELDGVLIVWRGVRNSTVLPMLKVIVRGPRVGLGFGLLIAGLIYSLLMFWIFVRSAGLPYGFDNNETFSNLIQGRNLLHFSSANSFLLTDESTDGVASGHPYVYTHGQNFPRFVAALLLLFGISGAEMHMSLSATAAGLVVTPLTFLAIRKIAGAFAGAVSAAFVASSVLYFLQTAPNTWRVWQAIVFSCALYLVATSLTGVKRKGTWTFGAMATGFIAVSTEIMFGVAVTTALFLAVLIRQPLSRPSTWLQALSAPLGSVLGLGLLFAQLVGALGLRTVFDDFRYTYLSRNTGDRQSVDFFVSNDIAFWRNFVDIDLGSTANLVHGPLSDFLAYGIAWAAVPFLLLGTALFTHLQWKDSPRSAAEVNQSLSNMIHLTIAVSSLSTVVFLIVGEVSTGGPGVIGGVAVGALFGLGVFAAGNFQTRIPSHSSTAFMGVFGGISLVLWVYATTVFTPLIPSPQVERRDLLLFLVGAVSAIFWDRVRGVDVARGSLAPFAKASLTVALVVLFLVALLPATAEILRISIDLGFRNSPWLQVLAFLAAWLIAGLWNLGISTGNLPYDLHRQAGINLSLLCAVFVVAATFVFLLSPGYFASGYSSRLVPFFSLLLPILTGAAVALMVGQICRQREVTFSEVSDRRLVLLGGSLFVVWLLANIMLIPQVFNKDFATTYRAVQAAAPDGVVSSSYPAPWAKAADTWAYLDLGIPSPPNIDQVLSGEQYVWIKGGLENPKFQSPSVAVCWSPMTPGQLLRGSASTSGACTSEVLLNPSSRLRPSFVLESPDQRYLILGGL